MSEETSRFRWLCKKGARHAVASGSAAFGKLASLNTRPHVRVLTYHRFGEATRDPFCVGASDFEAQIRYLAEKKLAISLAQMIKIANGEDTPKNSQVMVTIDDGLLSTFTVALPILRHFNVPAVAFISPGLIDKQIESGFHGEAAEPYVEWDQVCALTKSNISIGSHALSHRSLGNMTKADLEDEVRGSKAIIETKIDADVLSFAYPFGTYADFNSQTEAVIQQAGYQCAFTSQHGAVRFGAKKYELPRVKIEGGEDIAMFRRIVDGGLDAWRYVDRALWPLQARGI